MRRLLLVENLTLVAIILGVVAGFYLPDLMLRLRILGDVFIAMLGLGDIAKFRDMGIKTIAYYLTTTALAILVGLLLVSFLRL